MSAEHSAHDLQMLRDILLTHPAGFPIELADRLAAKIGVYFSKCCTLDHAMGLQLDRGERHPGTSEAMSAYVEALRSAAAKLGNNYSARRLAELMGRYASTAWPRERTCQVCPPQRVGRIEGDFWAAMKARPRVLGERQIRNLLEDRKNQRK